MTRTRFLALLAGLPLFVSACPDIQECPDVVYPSVRIHVVDLAGEPLSPTELFYRHDSGAEQPATCEDEDCTTALAGWGEAGNFVITAVFDEDDPSDDCCWYYDEAIVDVNAPGGGGGCTAPATVDVTIALDSEALACADTCG